MIGQEFIMQIYYPYLIEEMCFFCTQPPRAILPDNE